MKDALLMRKIPAPIGARYPFMLVPVDDMASEALRKLPSSKEEIAVTIKRGRSLQQHRLFFAILTHVAESTEWETPERLLTALKLHLHRYDLMQMPNGKVVPVPESISFSAMPQAEFQRFMDDSVRVICEMVLPGYDPDRLLAEAQHAIGIRADVSETAA